MLSKTLQVKMLSIDQRLVGGRGDRDSLIKRLKHSLLLDYTVIWLTSSVTL